jgi:hypothetical protein
LALALAVALVLALKLELELELELELDPLLNNEELLAVVVLIIDVIRCHSYATAA